MLGESVAGLDTEAFRVVVSSISWCVNERRVSGVAVTRHPVLVVSSVLVGTVDVDEKLDGPAVTVEFPCQPVLDDTAPSFREFPLDRLSPSNDRHDVRAVVGLKERETLAIVEFPVKIDGLDAEVKAVEKTKKLSQDTAGGAPSRRRRHRQQCPR